MRCEQAGPEYQNVGPHPRTKPEDVVEVEVQHPNDTLASSGAGDFAVLTYREAFQCDQNQSVPAMKSDSGPVGCQIGRPHRRTTLA